MAKPDTERLSLRKIAVYSKGAIFQETMGRLEKDLEELGRKHGGFSPAERRRIEEYQKLAAEIEEKYKARKGEDAGRLDAFYPGRPWLDTKGERIQAHAGAVFYENDTYYWYGEDKSYTDGKGLIWTWGVRAYESKDLYNWEELGLIIKPVVDNPESNLFPEKRCDRPYILKCDATGKYVCWFHLAGEDTCFVILQADAFCGPYEVVRENYRPFGYEVGDFDVVKDLETGKAYLHMDANHSVVYGMELSDDYLSAEKVVTTQYEGMNPPFCQEGIALFERNGKKYMLSSGMTGYIPNRSDSAISDAWTEPFASTGDPYVGDDMNSSFNSQFTQVFKVPGKDDCYIAISDRWVPEFPVDAKKAAAIERFIASRYDPKKYQATKEDAEIFKNSPNLYTANTSVADYVWLPLKFEGDKVKIEWLDEWKWD